MNVWAIADLHLSFGVLDKKMDLFGKHWVDHFKKIENHWKSVVFPEDLVLIAGDISWALKLEEAVCDLIWIDQLPGVKVFIKGNHDFWCTSFKKVQRFLPRSVHLIHNHAFSYQTVAVGGTRLWDFVENDFTPHIEKKNNPLEQKKIYQRELIRLQISLDKLDTSAKLRIAMLHYPPFGPTYTDTDVTRMLERYHIDYCVYGHLHNIAPLSPIIRNNITYLCTSCDFLQFCPCLVASL